MRKRDYENLLRLLCEHCSAAIQDFADREENQGVYAFSIYCTPDYGYAVGLNTEASFNRTIQEEYAAKSKLCLTGFLGVKFNPPDFAFFDLWPRSDELEALYSQYFAFLEKCRTSRTIEKHVQQFIEQAVLAIENLEQSLELLNRTDDFVAFVSLHDVSTETLLRLFRRTVPSDRFQQLFPEILAVEEMRRQIIQQPKEEQVQFWLQTCVKLSLGQASGLEALGITEYDACNKIELLGRPAVPSILSVIEQYASHREFNERGTWEFEEMGASTREANLTHLLLLGLIHLGYGDKQVHDRLWHLLTRVYSKNRDKDHSGLSPSLTARALHRLFPGRYPKPEISGSTNHLLNPEGFGLV